MGKVLGAPALSHKLKSECNLLHTALVPPRRRTRSNFGRRRKDLRLPLLRPTPAYASLCGVEEDRLRV